MQPNGSKCTQMVRNAPNHAFRVQGVDRVLSLRKIPMRIRGTNFALVRYVLLRDWQGNQMVPNAPKWYKTHQNMSLGSNGVDRVCSSRKTPTSLRGTNFCSSSKRFAPSFVRQPNGRQCTQTVRNAPKHEFRVQWRGSGGFIANSDATSWHELLH